MLSAAIYLHAAEEGAFTPLSFCLLLMRYVSDRACLYCSIVFVSSCGVGDIQRPIAASSRRRTSA